MVVTGNTEANDDNTKGKAVYTGRHDGEHHHGQEDQHQHQHQHGEYNLAVGDLVDVDMIDVANLVNGNGNGPHMNDVGVDVGVDVDVNVDDIDLDVVDITKFNIDNLDIGLVADGDGDVDNESGEFAHLLAQGVRLRREDTDTVDGSGSAVDDGLDGDNEIDKDKQHQLYSQIQRIKRKLSSSGIALRSAIKDMTSDDGSGTGNGTSGVGASASVGVGVEDDDVSMSMSRLEFQQWTSRFLNDHDNDNDNENDNGNEDRNEVEEGSENDKGENSKDENNECVDGLKRENDKITSDSREEQVPSETQRHELSQPLPPSQSYPKEVLEPVHVPAQQKGKQIEGVEYIFPQTTAAHFTSVVEDDSNTFASPKRRKIKSSEEFTTTMARKPAVASDVDNRKDKQDTSDTKSLKNADENGNADTDITNIDTNMFVRDAMMKAGLTYDEDGGSKDNEVRSVDNDESLAVEEVNRAVTQAVAAVSGNAASDIGSGVDITADAAVIAAAVAAAEDSVRKRMQSYIVEGDDDGGTTKRKLSKGKTKANGEGKPKKRRGKKDIVAAQLQDDSERAYNEKIKAAIEKVREGVEFASFDLKKFNKEETDLIDKFIKEYETISDITHEMFLNRIWGNERRKDKFWDILQQLLPSRTRSSLYKHVRRTYHIFEKRGIWTPEEDAKLAELCKTHEGKWKYIGEEIKRMPEDCRDRWRNYVKCGSLRNVNKWSVEEEGKLDSIVSKMREVSKTVNWTIVSELMDGTRSRIQCRYKWKKLRRAESVKKLSQMDSNTQRWLVARLIDHTKKPSHNDLADVDWDSLAAESKSVSKDNPAEWTGEDFQTLWEKLSTGVRARDKSVAKQGFHAEVAQLAAEVAQLVEEEKKAFVA